METKTIPVLLTLTGHASAGDQEADAVKLTTLGHFTYGDYPAGKAKLTYKEVQEDGGETSTIELTIGKNDVTMTRLGDYGTSMVFSPGQRYEGSYHTPFGEMDMAVFASMVQCHLTPDQGDIKLVYQLDLQGQFAAEHELNMQFHGRKKC